MKPTLAMDEKSPSVVVMQQPSTDHVITCISKIFTFILSRVDYSILIKWTSPFISLGHLFILIIFIAF